MPLKLPASMLQAELDALLAYWLTRPTWMVRLFVNDFQPSFSMVLANLTEATFAGYQAQPVPGWAPITFTPPDAITVATGPVAFDNQDTGPVTIYGYFLTDGNGLLMWAERDPAAPVSLAVGQTYVITLRRTQRNQGD